MRLLIDNFSRLTRSAAALAGVLALAACATPIDVATPPPVATEPDRTTIVAVNFGFDSHTIQPQSYAALDAIAAGMTNQRLAGYHFDVDGHTDIIGRLGYNIALSMLRANAVAEYLAARGVPRDSMHIQGFGPLRLFDPANPASPLNRRVEITSIR